MQRLLFVSEIDNSLLHYDWPGNVRELQNIVERAVVLASGTIVQIDEAMMRSGEMARESAVDTLENAERNHILRALNETHWVVHGKKGAAKSLGSIPAPCDRGWKNLGSSDRRNSKGFRVLSENWKNGGYRRFFYDHDLNEWNNWNFWNLGHRGAHFVTSRMPSRNSKTAPYWTGRRISAFTNQ